MALRQILAALPLAGGTLTGDLTVGNSSDLTVSGVTTLASSGVAATSERGLHVLPDAVRVPRIISINEGTTASPVTTAGPLVKVSKHESMALSQMSNNATNYENAAITADVYGGPDNEVQVCAIHAFAHGGGDAAGADVVAINGTAWINNVGATGYAGNFLQGRRNYDTGGCYGVEIRTNNQTLTDAAYQDDGPSDTMGVWITAAGTAQNAVGVAVSRLSTAPDAAWRIGFAAIENSVTDQTFRDDSSSTTSIDINGSHTDGIDMTGATLSNAVMRVPNNKAFFGRNAADSGDVNLISVNTSDEVSLLAGAATITATNYTITGETSRFVRATDDATGFGFNFVRSRAGGPSLANDLIGDINFTGRDSGNSNFTFARIRVTISDPTDTSEDGLMSFHAGAAGTLTERFRMGGTGISFFGVAESARPSAYTQTYSTADKTHAAPTAATLTVTDGAGTNDNTIGAITADASVIAAVQELADEINKLVVDVADVKQLVNSVIDDFQAFGLLQ